jgi:hypothetical protein
MARVTYGALITELAGSIGGITFHKNSSGNIARLKPNMPMIASPVQALQQNKFNSLIAMWPTLTNVQKTSWNNFAAAHPHINEFGQSKIINGFQWFMSCNLNLLVVNEATILTAPAYAPPAALPAFSIANHPTIYYIFWGVAQNVTPDYLVIYSSSPLRQTSLKLKRSFFFFRYIHSFNADSCGLTAQLASILNIAWGDLFDANGCTMIVRIKRVQTGTGLSSPYTSAMIKPG